MHQGKLHPQTRWIIAGAIGVLIAIIAILRIFLPTLSLLGQFSQFAPLVRAALIVKFLSPVLLLLLAGGWTWVLLFLGEQLILEKSKKTTDSVAQRRNLQEHRPHDRLERS